MNEYVLFAPTVAIGLVAVAFALLWQHDRSEHKKLCDAYLQEHTNDIARIADLHKAIAERDAEIKALHMNTIETQKATPVPARPKRPPKKAAEG